MINHLNLFIHGLAISQLEGNYAKSIGIKIISV